MDRMELSLPLPTGIHPSFYPDNFQLVDQRGNTYACNALLAQLVSGRVRQVLLADPTIDSFEIEVENDDFSVFLSLIRTGSVEISLDRLPSYIKIARALDNPELVQQLIDMHPLPRELTPENVLQGWQFYQLVEAHPPTELLDYTRSNFWRLTQVLAGHLEPTNLELIISEPLILASEDSFFDFLKGEMKEGERDLLKYVSLSCLSPDKLREFMGLLDLSTVTPELWKRIQVELCSIRSAVPRPQIHTYYAPSPRDPEKRAGIFALLSRMAGGNCADRDVIDVPDSSGDLKTLSGVLTGSDSRYSHPNRPGTSFCVDFKNRQVSVTHYAIEIPLYSRISLATWTLQGSNSNPRSDAGWRAIDVRSDDPHLSSSSAHYVFECNGVTEPPFRYIRLVQLGKSRGQDTYAFEMSHFELFGTISPLS
jgi:hypothetical protein